ncbi:MAG: N-acetylmuramoyl-L-alanine amidase [Parcubacteria bacterium C7867-005]|nr:MAG: N-acetylmuramoyl-L-alanine amidase [Parcubacteria bacterium C7867-005]
MAMKRLLPLLLLVLIPISLRAQTPTIAELQAQLLLLQKQIQAMQVLNVSSANIINDMGVGSTGTQVVALQQILISKGYLVMPPNIGLGYYGNLTEVAVKKFQSSNNVSNTGFVGPMTRTKLNSLNIVATTIPVRRSSSGGGGSSSRSSNNNPEAPTIAPLPVEVTTNTVTTSTTVAPAPVITPPVVVPQPSTEPQYQAGVNTSLWYDNFNQKLSSASIRSSYTTLGENSIFADNSQGVGGTNAVRFDWSASSNCQDDSKLLEWSFTPTNEIYVQYSVRYQSGFAFDWNGRSGCSGNAKKLFFLWAQSGSRFDFISENHTLGMGSDYDHPLYQQNVGSPVSVETLADGNWHRVTFHTRQSSTPNALDGFIHGWIDGERKWSHTNIATYNSGGYYLFKTPATFNQGSPVTQSEWMDDFRIWR